MRQWEGDLHTRVAAAIKRARGKRSAQWLADRTARLGYPITRAQIANYESGRKRTLDVADLIVIAAALNTSPVNLVFPGPYDESVELLPDISDTGIAAAEWFSGTKYPESLFGKIRVGDDPPRASPFNGEDWQQWEDNSAMLQLNRLLDELQQMKNDFLSDHDPKLGDELTLKRLRSIEDQIRLARKQLREEAGDA